MIRSTKCSTAFAVAVALTFGGYVNASEDTSGTIKSVDTARKEVVLKGTIKDAAYEVAKDATIYLDGVAAKLGDLKADDRVALSYDKKGDHFVATYLRALRSSQEATGKVDSTFADKREIVIKGTVKNTTYELTKDAVIWFDGKKGSMSDLREGDEVRLTYEQRGDHRMTNDVVIFRRK